jgi:DNA-binding NtrC family response regulator
VTLVAESQAAELKEGVVLPILLVDDDPALLQALPEMVKLRLPEVHIDTCNSGPAALARVQARRYNTIITDLHMPNVSGLTLLAEAGRARPQTPVILFSGRADEAIMRAAVDAGAYAFLCKPIERSSFVSTVKGALEAHFFRRQVAVHERILQRLTNHVGLLENVFSPRLRNNLDAVSHLTEAHGQEVARTMERTVMLCGRLTRLVRARKSFTERMLRWNLTRLQLLGQSDHRGTQAVHVFDRGRLHPEQSVHSRVLVVADDPKKGSWGLVDGLRNRLRDSTIEEVNDFQVALMLTAEIHYDTIICDLRMLDPDVVAFLTEMKKRRSDLPVILIGEGVPQAEEIQRQYGAVYLAKPLDLDRLLSVVKRVVAPRSLGERVKDENKKSILNYEGHKHLRTDD